MQNIRNKKNVQGAHTSDGNLVTCDLKEVGLRQFTIGCGNKFQSVVVLMKKKGFMRRTCNKGRKRALL